MMRTIVALLASVLTGAQAFLIITGRNGICLNEGCEVVDSFTKLPPLYFNVAGFLYFLTLFWCFFKGRKSSDNWRRFAKVLLLAGLAAEAVLLFFQYSIATTFCSYCLIIFLVILVLNILCGLQQLFTSLAIFIVVFVMLSTLEVRGVSSLNMSLDAGSYAQIGESGEGAEMYLFFSETCEHCENVISAIGEGDGCNIRFNPVDHIDQFSLLGSTRFSDYNPKVNTVFIKSLNIQEIPVLVAREQDRILVLKGESRIKKYLNDECLSGDEQSAYNGTSQMTGPGDGYVPVPKQLEEGCSVEKDCEEIKRE